MDTYLQYKTTIRDYLNKKIPNCSTKMYFLGLTLYLTSTFLMGTMIDNHLVPEVIFFKLGLLGGIIATLKALIFDDYTKEQGLIFALLGCVLYTSGSIAGTFVVFYTYIFLISAKNINFEDILQTFLLVNILGLALTFTLAGSDIIPNLDYSRSGVNIHRYALGTIYPTDLAARIFAIMLAYSLFKKWKMSIIDFIVLIATTIVTYLVTDTRLDLVLMVLLITLLAINRFKPITTWHLPSAKIINYCITGFIALTLTIYATFMKHNPVYKLIDKLLSGRLYFGHKALVKYPKVLFGQYIPQNGNGGTVEKVKNYFFIDSSLIRTLMMFGIFTFILFLILTLKLSSHFMAKQLLIMEMSFLLILLCTAIDQHLWELSFTPIYLSTLANTSYFKLAPPLT